MSSSSPATLSDVRPYASDREPQALLPIIPPIVQRGCVDGSGPKRTPCGDDGLLQDGVHGAGLDDRGPRLGVDGEHAVQVPGEVEHEPRPDGVARHRRARRRGEVSGTPVSRATARRGGNLVDMPRADHGERRDPVQRRVGGVHAAGAGVGPDLEPRAAQCATTCWTPRPWVTCYSCRRAVAPAGGTIPRGRGRPGGARLGSPPASSLPDDTYSVYQLADLLGCLTQPRPGGTAAPGRGGPRPINRNRGFQVVPPRAHDIEEIIDIRLALEPPAARRAAEHGN